MSIEVDLIIEDIDGFEPGAFCILPPGIKIEPLSTWKDGTCLGCGAPVCSAQCEYCGRYRSAAHNLKAIAVSGDIDDPS